MATVSIEHNIAIALSAGLHHDLDEAFAEAKIAPVTRKDLTVRFVLIDIEVRAEPFLVNCYKMRSIFAEDQFAVRGAAVLRYQNARTGGFVKVLLYPTVPQPPSSALKI